jgi:Mn-dependent DtxR family transcriptional regulator
MSVKMKDVLKAMRELRAFDFDSHTTQLAVVKRINRTHQVASYRRAFKELSEKGWKAGEAGRGRGIWLTAEGRRMAEAIRQKDAEEK